MTDALPFELKPLDATFGAVVTGVRLPDLDAAGFAALYDAWLEHALLVFPGQGLTRDEQIAFANRFGPLEFDCVELSNVRPDGSLRPADGDDDMVKILKGNMGWHADSTYMPVQAKGAVFSAHIVPSEGGETAWADMRAALDALSPSLRARIERLSAYHSLEHSQRKLGFEQKKENSEYIGYGYGLKDVPLRPLVKTHPETGRPSLLIGRHAHAIPGMDAQASEALLEELMDFACRPPRIYTHAWAPGDAVVWDNRCLLHRGCPWDMREKRVMLHSRIAGDPASEGMAAA